MGIEGKQAEDHGAKTGRLFDHNNQEQQAGEPKEKKEREDHHRGYGRPLLTRGYGRPLLTSKRGQVTARQRKQMREGYMQGRKE